MSLAEKASSSDQPPAYSLYQAPQQPPQQQVGYPAAPQRQAITTTTFVTQPTVGVPIILPIVFGPYPMNMTCPHCQSAIVTSTDYEPGMLTWLACGGVALVGFWCGCCFIPFCMDSLQDCRHSCPNCKNFLGVYRRI